MYAAGLWTPAEPAALEIVARWLATVDAATSIIGISRRSAKGDQAARTSSADPAIMRSNSLPPPAWTSVVLVIAAVARLMIETITNLARMTATSSSTSRRAHRLAAGQIIATNVSGRKKRAM